MNGLGSWFFFVGVISGILFFLVLVWEVASRMLKSEIEPLGNEKNEPEDRDPFQHLAGPASEGAHSTRIEGQVASPQREDASRSKPWSDVTPPGDLGYIERRSRERTAEPVHDRRVGFPAQEVESSAENISSSPESNAGEVKNERDDPWQNLLPEATPKNPKNLREIPLSDKQENNPESPTREEQN